ncbi:hypothetical protein [Speluncibacter jeojiensis]|uniref:Cell division protein FtsL n=1 Tax=Speluncibacter jeojiensis TaxID=2710754 RepID=A0A9X4RCD6_9ACTN|nr:hypothetical protein [Corynebacteriales bacterium D3-21]
MVLVIALLTVGMGLTLWLTTTSAEQSYELSAQNATNQNLQEKKATLEKAVAAGNSAPVLAQKAAALGMVPTMNVARIVVGADGVARVEGKPAAATGPAAPALNRPAGSAPIVIQPAPVPGRPAAPAPGPTGLPLAVAPAAPAAGAPAPAPGTAVVPGPTGLPVAAAPAPAPAAPAPAAPAPAPAPAAPAPAARQAAAPAPAPAQGEQSVPVNTLPPVLTGPLATGQP